MNFIAPFPKNDFLKTLFLVIFLALTGIKFSSAATITSQTNGNWNAPGTWDLGVIPANGDDVVIADGTTVTITAAVNLTSGSLTVGQGNSGALNIGGFAVTITGDLVINAGATVNCTSATGTKTFNNITNYGTWTNNANAVLLTCYGNFDNEATFNQNAGALNLAAASGTYAYTNNGTHTLTTGAISFTGAASVFSFTNNSTFTAGTSTVNFTGATSCTYSLSGNDPLFYNVTINNSTLTVDASGMANFSVTANFTLTNGSFNGPAIFTVGNCTVANSATAILNAGAQIYVSGNWNIGKATSFVPGQGSVIFNGSGAQTIGTVTGLTFYDVEIGNTGTATFTSAITITVLDILTIDAGATLASGATTIVNIGYQWINNGGVFTPSGGTVVFDNQGYYNNIGGTLLDQTFNNITVAMGGWDLDVSGLNTLTLTGNLTITGGGLWPPGSFNGYAQGAQTITVAGNVTLSTTTGSFFAPLYLYVGGNWTITGAGNGGTRAAFDIYDEGPYDPDAVIFNGTGNQTISGVSPQNFQDLIVDKASGTLTSTVTSLIVNDNFTLTNGTYVSNDSTIINPAGNPNTFVLTAGTFSGSGITTVTGSVYQSGGAIASTGTFYYTSFEYQHVCTGSYKNLVFDDNDKVLQPGTINITGVFTPGAAVNDSTAGNTIVYTGAVAQTVSLFNFDGFSVGSGYNNLTMATAKVTLDTSIAVSGIFDFTAIGKISLGAYSIIIGDSGSIAPGAGFSNTHMLAISGTGRLVKNYNTGAQSFLYPLGIATNYTPVTLNLNNVTLAGAVGVIFNGVTDPNNYAPTTSWLKKYWTFDDNGSGITFDNYSAEVTYLPADYNTGFVAGNAATMSSKVWNGVWADFINNKTSLTPTVSGITTLGELTFKTCDTLSKTSDPVADTVCVSGGTAVYTVGYQGTPSGFQWYQNGSPLNDVGIYSGTHSATLTLTNPGIGLNGDTFYCVVTASCTGGFTSNAAGLLVSTAEPAVVSTVTASPNTYHPGDDIVITATDTFTPPGTKYQFVEAFPQSGGGFLVPVQNTSSDSLVVDNISAYGTSIKSPGVTWLFVYANNACGRTNGAFYQISVIPPTTSVNPSACGDTDGHISFPGLITNNLYTVNYDKNNVAQPQLTLTTSAGGILTIPNLGAGVYSNIVLQVLNQGSSSLSAPADPVTLIDPCGGLNVYNVTYNNGTSTAGAAVNVCAGITNIGLANADTGVTYQLYEGVSLVATHTPLLAGAFNFVYTPLAGNTYTVTATDSGKTTAMNGSVIVHADPTVVISNSGLSGCVNPGVTLGTTGSAAGSGNIALYQWSNSSGIIVGANGTTYTVTATGTYSLAITNSNLCSATSSAVSVTVSSVTASVNLAADKGGAVCAGTGITFTATPNNGGTPVYNFTVNGTSVQKGTAATYFSNYLNNNDTVNVTMTSNAACVIDSMITGKAFIAQILPVAIVTINQSICSGQSFEGHSQPGTFVDTFRAFNGCDSIRTLNLTFLQAAIDTTTHTICHGQSFEGHNTAGIFTDTIQASGGCDSIISVLNLSVTLAVINTSKQIICQGDSFNGHSVAGYYSDTILSKGGCDSLIMNLELEVLPSSVQPTITQQGDTLISTPSNTYAWYEDTTLLTDVSQTLVITRSGQYSVETTDTGSCPARSKVFDATLTGINNIAGQPLISVYPDPASDYLNIHISELSRGSDIVIHLYNALGQLMLSQTAASKTVYDAQLNISGLSGGFYFLNIQQDGWAVNKKILITR